MAPKHSNLRIRSNVYWRDSRKPVSDDLQFARLVRGRGAISQLLSQHGVPLGFQTTDNERVRALLKLKRITPAQAKSCEWTVPCSRCGEMPYGLTFKGTVELRCEVAGCVARQTVGHFLAVPRALIGKARESPDFYVRWAIQALDGKAPEGFDPGEQLVRIPVRIDATLSWLYLDDQLAAFLRYGLEHYDEANPHV